MILAHQAVQQEGARGTAYVLHGVLGSGNNFRSFVLRLTRERPEWRFVLVDLRHHGRSVGAEPPNTIEACVQDLLELSGALGTLPEIVIGHSFGGKVALAYARHLSRVESIPGAAPDVGNHLESIPDGGKARVESIPDIETARAALQQVWALDSNPGAQKPGPDNQVLRVMAALRATSGPFPTRQAAVDALTMGRGLSTGLAQWLVTNLERRGDELVWRYDLDAIEELLEDYFREDLWDYLEAARGAPEHHLLVAERSDRWTGAIRDRVRHLPPSASVRLHELPDAGHWVHVDNPTGLLAILREHLSTPKA